MAVKLHRCKTSWLKINAHGCWRVEKALRDRGIDFEVVTHPHLRGKRDDLQELSGQRVLPVLELDDGRAIREESKDLAAKIEAGELP